MPEAILGISAFYHDSAAVLLVDGRIVAAAQEERFTRKKHDAGFPHHAAKYVLEEGGYTLEDLAAVAFYDKPYLKFERLLETYNGFAPRGLKSFLSAIPVWVKEKLFMRKMLREELARLGQGKPQLLFPEHHLSHAASAFYPSPFEDAAILTVDGVGEWATTTIGKGAGKDISILRELHFPHSLGLLYSAFTSFCGFRVNSGEYKLMGLAPYGNSESPRIAEWKACIYEQLIDVREDGSLLLNMDYFNYATGLTMCCNEKWEALFGIPARRPETEIGQEYMDLALAIQQVTENIVLRLAETARELTGCENLVMAGGVALNCVANGKLLRKGIFKDVWIQPAAGDAGGALGAALAGWHIWRGRERTPEPHDAMCGAYLGPEFGPVSIERMARKHSARFRKFDDFAALCSEVGGLLAKGNVVGWFQGRMEYGPRALGNRSILGDPRHPEMQKKLNLKIKYREGFRPFAPSVIEEEIPSYFELDRPSPYMLIVAPVEGKRCNPLPENYGSMPMYERLYVQRSDIPAVTHVDFSARIQSVSKRTNPRYWQLIDTFRSEQGCGLVVNTSFNVRGEPIVCTPEDAFTCFMRTEMDYLVLGDCLFAKADQSDWSEQGDWRESFDLD
ncbi:carbamoyltransferase family protein [Salidesulfovibrio onnuriiensis]|uniref:carbamoyltransferase family protein n=1 Tax=Salidesulfovibrio onnuriiensis TaxID=2583823 RepID=UPI0011CC2D51|nr:carbamoyltransferase [Salidesulfovibrio onnuriiensis]